MRNGTYCVRYRNALDDSGQIIILLLIQIGGMGVVTIAVSLALPPVKNRAVQPRNNENLISAPNVERNRSVDRIYNQGDLLIEIIRALIMLPVFYRDYGAEGIWMAVFHSVSAFCNAGFDIMGTKSGEFTSLTHYSAQPVINITIMLLIIVGGIGFLVWERLFAKTQVANKRNIVRKSKLVLIVTGCADCFTRCLFLLFLNVAIYLSQSAYLRLYFNP